jgi:hypothetical protein
MKKDTPFIETMRVIKEFLTTRKVGNVQVNMFKGNISTVNVNETKNWKAEEKD